MKLVEIACPFCFSPLLDLGKCPKCSYKKVVKEGYLEMHRNDNSWAFCEQQVKAVRVLEAKDKGGYTSIPASEEGVNDEHGAMLEKSLELLGDLTDKVFLDLGGKGGYYANYFINHGAKGGVVLDIDAQEIVKETDRIIPIVGDGYYIPIADNQFDFVFDSSALHHFEHKTIVLEQLKRVLKPEGKYISIGNPPRVGVDDDDRTKYWHKYQLLETMPTKEEYDQFFVKVFGHVEFIEIMHNMIMYTNKE